MSQCGDCPNAGLSDRFEQSEKRMIETEKEVARFASALEGIKANTDELLNVAKQQIRLEERQISQGQAIERAFKAIEDIGSKMDARVRALEATAPTNNLASRWVFGAVVFIVAGVGAYIGGKI